ncbi:hypothetical protein HY229_05915 [Candidatus Acetothermia bacterium]|nr:hypothetical protein [Candidatus Acetothermia bacterium]MBI3643619.1 hypothetical protein [Candidatus Acetothermia bacterium]
MHKFIKGALLAFLVVGIFSGPAFAQMGVGLKIPAMEIFVSDRIAENTQVEAGVSISALLNSIIGLEVSGKKYFNPFDVGIQLQPYVGLELTIAMVSGAIFFSPAALVGAEYHVGDTSFHIFAEATLGVAFGSLGIGIVPGGQLGARYDF